MRIGENEASENSTGKFTWVTLATQPAYESPESAGVVSIHYVQHGRSNQLAPPVSVVYSRQSCEARGRLEQPQRRKI